MPLNSGQKENRTQPASDPAWRGRLVKHGQARCLTSEELVAIKWWQAQWYKDWQRTAGIQN